MSHEAFNSYCPVFLVWGEMALGDTDYAMPQGGYDSAMSNVPAMATGRTSDFSFTQPDVMPPR